MRRNLRLALAIFIFVALGLSAIDMARSQLVEMRSGEAAAERAFDEGRGEPWIGGNSYIENNPTECPFKDNHKKGVPPVLTGKSCPLPQNNSTALTGYVALSGQNVSLAYSPETGKILVSIAGEPVGYLTLAA